MQSAHTIVEDSRLSQLISTAQSYQALDAWLKRELPPRLANTCQVICVREGELVVFADNGAVAAKLRALEGDIVARAAKQGMPLRRVRIRVQINLVPLKKPKNLAIGAGGIASLTQAASTVNDPNLAAALARLVRHQCKT